MAQITAFDDVKATRVQKDFAGGHLVWRTELILPALENPRTAQAFLAESTPRRVLPTHYHDVDQFQVVVHGDGTLAKHQLAPGGVHFARAHTPYGPITNGSRGLGFLTLRARGDEGAHFIPEKLERLKSVPARQPWQVTEMPHFPSSADAVTMQTLSKMRDENGLAGYAFSMKPEATALTPDPSDSDGQFICVLKGSLISDGREYNATAVAFVAPNEGRFRLAAGAQGLDALVLHFPRPEKCAARVASHGSGTAYKTWQCTLCSFVYDEAAGMPDEGIAPGTHWDDVPESWSCPDCSASKADFDMVEI